MFERLKRGFGRKQTPVGAGRVVEPVFAGHVIEIVNAELNLSLYGSLHEIRLAAADAVSTPFLDVVNNLDTRIVLAEARLTGLVTRWHGGPYADDVLSLMDHVDKGETREVVKYSEALRSSADGSQLPLINATANGDVDMVDALLKAGAPPHGAATLGMTALHWACGRGYERIAEMLVLAGADQALPNWFAFTPIELAVMNRHEKLAKKLDPRSASPDGINWYSVTTQRLQSAPVS